MLHPDFHLILWNTETGSERSIYLQQLEDRKAPTVNDVYSVAISPDAHHVISGGAHGCLRLWDLDSAHEIHRWFELRSDIGAINSVAFSPDGRLVAAVGTNGLSVLDLDTRTELHRFPGGFAWFNQLAFSADSQHLLCGSFSTSKLIDVETGLIYCEFEGYTGVEGVALSTDGALALFGCEDGSLHLWDVQSRLELRQWHHGSRVREEGIILSISHNSRRTITHLKSKRTSVAFSPNGLYALSGAFQDKTMCLWDINSGREVCRFMHDDDVVRVAFLPDDLHALSACWTGSVYLWKLPL